MISIPYLVRRRECPSSSASLDAFSLPTAYETSSKSLKRKKRMSKNCKNAKKRIHSTALILRNQERQQHEALLERELCNVQRQIQELEQRRVLLQSMELMRRTNAMALMIERIRDYYRHFARGYDPSRCVTRAQFLESVVRAVMTDDVQGFDFAGISVYLKRWEHLSKYHAEITVCVEEIQPSQEEDDDDCYVIRTRGYTTFRINRDTLAQFFRPILRDERLVQQLIGREYAYPFESIYYCNKDGLVERMEPRAALATGLSKLVNDPFETTKLLTASSMTEYGCLVVVDA